MTMAIHSIMKRSLPCLDLISMASTQSGCDCDGNANADCAHYSKKRPPCAFGWDHYRSHEDVDTLSEHQSWRNKKRSRKSESHITTTSRVKIPFHRRFSSVSEGEVEADGVEIIGGSKTKQVPRQIYLENDKAETKFDDAFEESSHPAVNYLSPVGEITHDLAMM